MTLRAFVLFISNHCYDEPHHQFIKYSSQAEMISTSEFALADETHEQCDRMLK